MNIPFDPSSLRCPARGRIPTTTWPRCAWVLSLVLGGPAACGDDGNTDTGPVGTTAAAATSTGADETTTSPTSTGGPDETTSGTRGDTTAASSDGSTEDTGVTSTGDSTTGAAGLEIAGEWFEDFGDGTGVTHTIDALQWEQLSAFGDALFHVDGYDNAGRWVVAQGDAANEFFPGLYSKFNWTWDGAALYYCTAVFDAASPEDAQAAADADAGDLVAGCGGFPWSPLVPGA